jgi:nitrate reductase NapAB chaperone NapD
MHYSGILVVVDPIEVKSSMDELAELPGVEVHYCEPESGRIIVVQETDTLLAQEEGLRSIQALPRVKMAALVEHRVDREATEVEAEK